MRLYKLCTPLILLFIFESQQQSWAHASADALRGVQRQSLIPRVKRPTSAQQQALTGSKRINLWTSVSHSRFKDDFFIIKAKGRTTSEAVGMDYKVIRSLKLGLSYRHDDLKSTTLINSGKTLKKINTISPYLSYTIQPWLYFNMAGGYGHAETHTRSIFNNGLTVKGQNASNIWFASPSLLASYVTSNFIANLSAGFSHYTEKQNSYIDSISTFVPATRWTTDTGQLVADLRYVIQFKDSSFLKGVIPGVQGGGDYLIKQTPIVGTIPGTIGRKFTRAKTGYIAAAQVQFLFDNNIFFTVRGNQYWGHTHLMVRGISALLSCNL